MLKLFLLYIIFVQWIKTGFSRSVPARQDLCNRFPSMDMCRSSSSATANDPPPPISAARASSQAEPAHDLPTATNLDRNSYCSQFQPHYSYYCSADKKSTNDKQAAAFCDSFTTNCDTKAPPQANPEAPTSPDQVTTLCTKYKNLAHSFCKDGNEAGDIKKYCDLYRTFCTGPGAESGPGAGSGPADASAPKSGSASSGDPDRDRYCNTYKPGFYQHCSEPTNEAKTVQFCQAYNNYCAMGIAAPSASQQSSQDNPPTKLRGMVNANTSAVVRAQCEQYKSLADVYCPGFEVSEMRQNCNMYRVYCQGKAPFPGIDGNIGFTNNVWGVAGIPFYPFNPQGAIAGGKRSNVGYGDWGGSYTERDGVSDFYDTQKKVNANWQKGNYMVNDGWNVPLAGISGFRQNGVQLNGLGNPSDWPALQSGGLPVPAFGSGLGPMPNFGGSAGGIPLIGK